MNNTLKILFLHWNKIQSRGFIKLFQAIEKNNTLQILDVSFNTVGGDKNNLAAKQFSIASQANKSIIHLDISHCNFSLTDIEIISEGLLKNHTILGIHMIGNKATIDNKGMSYLSDLYFA